LLAEIVAARNPAGWNDLFDDSKYLGDEEGLSMSGWRHLEWPPLDPQGRRLCRFYAGFQVSTALENWTVSAFEE
jgi:hypothetical protein